MSEPKYLVAARKYRPQRFDEVVAQEHVCDTLKNAVTRDRLGHAYLFSGPRGVGKTTVARILAKSINCTTPLEKRGGAEPCQACDSCKSFAQGRNLNVIEIDAASNRGIDDARELRDTVRIPPQGALKKVYIVDEVHMLTPQAFNALLKTLEEPPPYVLFIFATTEPNKVLPTILSRCQRFDFRRIPTFETVERLKVICAEESIAADEASLLLIAQKGDGALRDALSVFDQAVALCGTSVTYDELAEALGVVDIDFFFDLTQSIRHRDPAGVLNLVQRIVAAGLDFREFLSGLAEHLRNLFVAITMPDTGLIEASSTTKDRYATESRAFNRSTLLRLLTIVSDTDETLRTSIRPRLQLELGLLKMANIGDVVDIRQAIRKIDEIRSVAAEAGEQPAAGRVEIRPASESVREPERRRQAAPDPGTATAPDEPKPTQAEEHPPTGNAETAVDVSPPPGEQRSSDASAATEPAPPSTDAPATNGGGAQDLFGTPALAGRTRGQDRNPGTIEGSTARAAAAATQVSAATGSIAEWLPFVKAVKSARIHVGSLLQHAAPRRMEEGLIEIDVPDDFHRRLLENQQDFLLKHARYVIDDEVRSLRFSVRAGVAPTMEETTEDFDPYEYMQRKRKDNPVIRAIFDEFGGELVW